MFPESQEQAEARLLTLTGAAQFRVLDGAYVFEELRSGYALTQARWRARRRCVGPARSSFIRRQRWRNVQSIQLSVRIRPGCQRLRRLAGVSPEAHGGDGRDRDLREGAPWRCDALQSVARRV